MYSGVTDAYNGCVDRRAHEGPRLGSGKRIEWPLLPFSGLAGLRSGNVTA